MANLPPLRVLADVYASDIRGLPVLTAYGDPDDHLRLTVLIAEHLRTRARGTGIVQLADDCTNREKSWDERYRALTDLLREARPQRDDQYFGVLVDIDAIDTGPLSPEMEWDDREFGWQRSKLLQALKISARRGGWIVVRGQPSKTVDLPPPEPLILLAPPAPDLGEIYAGISPDCQPILRWLVESKTLSSNNIKRRFDAADGDMVRFERHLVSVVYDVLSERAAEAAERLSVVRPPWGVNGTVAPETLRELCACGFLQPWPAAHEGEIWRMPRRVRVLLEQQAMAGIPKELGDEHRRLACIERREGDVEEQIEAHHHAVRVHPAQDDDIERAFDSAHYYMADLREMAFHLSAIEKRYDKAAAIFKRIVDSDHTDAYAWEYLAYNLARAHKDKAIPDREQNQILEAYENAIFFDRNSDNPLYHGRLLGFRARIGEDVRREFDQKMRHYLESPVSSAVSYFAEAVLKGLPRGAPQRTTIINRWKQQLVKHPRLSDFVEEAA